MDLETFDLVCLDCRYAFDVEEVDDDLPSSEAACPRCKSESIEEWDRIENES